MKKTIKFSLILLFTGLAGTASVAAKEIVNASPALETVTPVNEKEKGKKVSEKESFEVGKPFFRYADNQVSVNLLNLDGNPVQVQVVDNYDRVLFREVIKGEHTIGKKFDFSNVADGVYTIVVKDCENQYYKKVEKL